jgi:DNA-binding response OmpR family regulator
VERSKHSVKNILNRYGDKGLIFESAAYKLRAMKSILCVEDNAEIQILVEASLAPLQVNHAGTISDARALLAKQKFDLLILDLELPDGDGLKFLTELNGHTQKLADTPVFILTGKSETANKVIAFSLGVEDFISKPFDPIELRARVTAKLRKLENSQELKDTIKIKDLTIQLGQQRVFLANGAGQEEIGLTSLEFKLLTTFARAAERVLSRDHLLDVVWGSSTHITDRTVDTHVAHLRKKISASQAKIETVINEGYRLKLG